MTGVELAEIALELENCLVCRDSEKYCDACHEKLASLVDDECSHDGAFSS